MIDWERAYQRLAEVPFQPRAVAHAFALATGARRVVYFPPAAAGLAPEGIDAVGARIRRYIPSAFEFSERCIGNGRDGLCPVADRDPGLWFTVRLAKRAGGVAVLQAPHPPDEAFSTFCLVALARIIADAEVTAAREHAARDPLTGLLRREALEAQVARMERYIVIAIDCNGLKAINDTQGHAAGDRYLQAAAAALQHAVRTGDPVARFGGDEFVVVGPSLDVVGRVRSCLAAASVSASLGAAVAPDDGMDFASVLARADARMYEEKRAYHEMRGAR
ncbi:GGDEF domain-containing protein [bacterium]|nr:MAG: GGDEF domain-containing protein [bacterium]